MQWNANGLKNKMVELEDKTRLLEIDPRVKTPFLRCKPETERLHKDRDVGRGGGLVTFIKEDIPFAVIDHSNGVPNYMLEILMTDIQAPDLHLLTFVNVYCPPSRGSHHGHEFCTTEVPSEKNVIIGGDLNGHSAKWYRWQPEDTMGAKLEQWLCDYDFGVANDGSATRTNDGSGGSSAPDVTLVYNSWLGRVEWSTTQCMGSDHLPIVMSVDCQIVTLQPPPITELRWNRKKADFVGFSKKVEDKVNNAPIGAIAIRPHDSSTTPCSVQLKLTSVR